MRKQSDDGINHHYPSDAPWHFFYPAVRWIEMNREQLKALLCGVVSFSIAFAGTSNFVVSLVLGGVFFFVLLKVFEDA